MTPVDDAVRKMHDLDVGALVVMDFNKLDVDKSKKIHLEELYYAPKSNAIAGIVSERDYLRAVAMNKVTDLTIVREIMTPAVDTATDETVNFSGTVLFGFSRDAVDDNWSFQTHSGDQQRVADVEGLVSLGDAVKA